MLIELETSAVIFDLDGVLVDSSAVVDQTWIEWSKRHGLDAGMVLRTIPGKRTRDAVLLLAPDSDIDAETARIMAREESLVELAVPIPGAAALLAQLPAGRWGIATSGTNPIARSRLAHAGLDAPEVFITAEMVSRGKPHPEVYTHAARALGFDAAQCVVFEDAPSGVASATAAGSTVVGVLTWAEAALLGAAYAVQDLRAVRPGRRGSTILLGLHDES